VNRDVTCEEYGRTKLLTLLDDAVFEMHSAARLKDPESIHKMRVAIRRLQQGLRVFGQYIPDKASKRIKRELRDVMKIAGEVRNRDIALKLLKKNPAILKVLQKQRLEHKRQLITLLRDISRPDLSIKWRTRLELH
jgi:CHAD domain-containing protein